MRSLARPNYQAFVIINQALIVQGEAKLTNASAC